MGETLEPDKIDVWTSVKNILNTIDRDREREIISRRFGLYDRKETLEQIGELLGITRERVRQLEKAILSRLKAQADNGELPSINDVEKAFIMNLHELGRVARISALSARVTTDNNDRDQAHVAFLSVLAPGLAVLDENDKYYHAVGIAEYGDEKAIKANVDKVVEEIKKIGKPVTIKELHTRMSYEHPDYIRAYASISKQLANLKDKWGLIRWPTVNPKNIRDKIYVVLQDEGKPMHFNDIARSIRQSNFKRKDVTTQAIHNELIKDKRFVLIGRGIYALSEWGYKKGTVATVITDVLKAAGEPLHRDEIVKRVLKTRQVKETTILLNLQSKPQFKRVAKATYTTASEK